MKYVIVEKAKSFERFIDAELQKEREKDPLHPMHRKQKTLGEAVSKPLHENIKELAALQERGKHLDKLLEEQKKETWTRVRRGKTETVHRRKPTNLVKVRNPNPHGETYIWVKPKKAEKVEGYVPTKREPKTGWGRDHLD